MMKMNLGRAVGRREIVNWIRAGESDKTDKSVYDEEEPEVPKIVHNMALP